MNFQRAIGPVVHNVAYEIGGPAKNRLRTHRASGGIETPVAEDANVMHCAVRLSPHIHQGIREKRVQPLKAAVRRAFGP